MTDQTRAAQAAARQEAVRQQNLRFARLDLGSDAQVTDIDYHAAWLTSLDSDRYQDYIDALNAR